MATPCDICSSDASKRLNMHAYDDQNKPIWSHPITLYLCLKCFTLLSKRSIVQTAMMKEVLERLKAGH